MKANKNYFGQENQSEGIYVRYYDVDYECQRYCETFNEHLIAVQDFIVFVDFKLYGKNENETIEEFLKELSYNVIEDITGEGFHSYNREIIGRYSDIDLNKFKKVKIDLMSKWVIYSKIRN
jgi:hypothetical protein